MVASWMMPPHLQKPRSLNRHKIGPRSPSPYLKIGWIALAIFLFLNLLLLRDVVWSESSSPSSRTGAKTTTQQQCRLRKYPPHRYYHLNDRSIDFLRAEYIYGEWPVVVPTTTPTSAKLCVDQRAWHSSSNLPFSDGTNPSILSLSRLPAVQQEALRRHFPTAAFMATACMTNSQCSWNDTPQIKREYNLSNQTGPSVVLTVLLLLNDHFETLAQQTIELERDARWGKLGPSPHDGGSRHIPALDDARLFMHQDRIWISYREGVVFGYNSQMLNPVHWSEDFGSAILLKASETASFCCGRNMALMQDGNLLKSLTWVDPVTVVSVDTKPLVSNNKKRRLQTIKKVKKRKSHVHGTNAFMVLLPHRNEFLGMGHFHRPPDRSANEYAHFGHHYTHAWFTITSQEPYRLTALSPEFVFPSAYDRSDAEVIQFASGLELEKDIIVVAYGINDCEAAVATIPLRVVEAMLRPVAANQQVVDLMKAWEG